MADDWPAGTPVRSTSLDLTFEPVSPEQRRAGAPSTGWVELGAFAGLDLGVWEMTSGTMTDVEADEVFVVVSGRGVLEVYGAQGTQPRRSTIERGDVVRPVAGMRTLWTVTEPLRKVYLTPST